MRILIGLLVLTPVFAQQPAPSFEVASLKPSPQGPAGACQRRMDCIDVTPTSLTIKSEPLRGLIRWAWDLPPVQIEGPAWLTEVHYDLIAKASKPVTEIEIRAMLRTLLADRFGLKTHTESRTMAGYGMSVAKGGVKVQESTSEGSFVIEAPSPVMLTAHHARMVDIANAIAAEIQKPVVDETGLKGRYEVKLDVSPYIVQAGNNAGGLDMFSILFTGFKDLLGLQLESKKVTADMLIVDHAEKTVSEN